MPKPVLQQVQIQQIRTDGGTQQRAGEMNHEVIKEYAEAMRQGNRFPPIDVFYDGTNYWLADGFYRRAAYELNNEPVITCLVYQGTQRDAVKYSLGANAGLRRTNADKRTAVFTALADPEWRRLKDQRIADLTRTTQPFVRARRIELQEREAQEPVEQHEKELKVDAPEQKEPEDEKRPYKRPKLGKGLNFRGLLYQPTDEQEVLYLFATVAVELGYDIVSIRAPFPDCHARVLKESKKRHRGQRPDDVVIEFEIRSRTFKAHGHIQQMQDYGIEHCLIVCWEDNWSASDRPQNIDVLELKSEIQKLKPDA